MELKERAKLELERRAENRGRKIRGEEKLRTVDAEMRELSAKELRALANGEPASSPV